MDTKRRAAIWLSVGLVAASASVALTSVVDVTFTSSPTPARLVMSGLVQESSATSSSPSPSPHPLAVGPVTAPTARPLTGPASAPPDAHVVDPAPAGTAMGR